MLLRDKVVIVTGVGPGLGRSLAEIAAAEGAKVALAARNRDFLDEVKAGIEAAGGVAVAIPCDVSVADQCAQLVRVTAEAFGGRIDGLVNSAYHHGDWSFVENADEAEWVRAYEVNCLGALRMTKAVLPFMTACGGAIVNVSTMATVRPYGTEFGMEMGYAASKAGLNVLAKYMASDLGRHGIRVNTCRMGWMYGAPVRAFIDARVAAGEAADDVIGGVTRDIPLGVIPPEEDCARTVLVFLSDYTRMVTGATLDVNGGHWMAP